jgi:hypothetical protein
VHDISILVVGFCAPLSLALLGALYNFVGQLRYARSESHHHQCCIYFGDKQISESAKELKAAIALQNESNEAYRWADRLCVWMVWAFIFILILVVGRMSYGRL